MSAPLLFSDETDEMKQMIEQGIIEGLLRAFSRIGCLSEKYGGKYSNPKRVSGFNVWIAVRENPLDPNDHQAFMVWRDPGNEWHIITLAHSPKYHLICTGEGYYSENETVISLSIIAWMRSENLLGRDANRDVTIRLPTDLRIKK